MVVLLGFSSDNTTAGLSKFTLHRFRLSGFNLPSLILLRLGLKDAKLVDVIITSTKIGRCSYKLWGCRYKLGKIMFEVNKTSKNRRSRPDSRVVWPNPNILRQVYMNMLRKLVPQL